MSVPVSTRFGKPGEDFRASAAPAFPPAMESMRVGGNASTTQQQMQQMTMNALLPTPGAMLTSPNTAGGFIDLKNQDTERIMQGNGLDNSQDGAKDEPRKVTFGSFLNPMNLRNRLSARMVKKKKSLDAITETDVLANTDIMTNVSNNNNSDTDTIPQTQKKKLGFFGTIRGATRIMRNNKKDANDKSSIMDFTDIDAEMGSITGNGSFVALAPTTIANNAGNVNNQAVNATVNVTNNANTANAVVVNAKLKDVTQPTTTNPGIPKFRSGESMRLNGNVELRNPHIDFMKLQQDIDKMQTQQIQKPSPTKQPAMNNSSNIDIAAGSSTDLNQELPSRVELRKVLKDFYAFHDPVKPDREIDIIVEWIYKNGLEELNQVLRQKYKADLVIRKVSATNIQANADLTESTNARGPRRKKHRSRNRAAAIPSILVENRKQVADSARVLSQLVTPGLEDDSGTIEDLLPNLNAKIAKAIDRLETSKTPEDIRDNLLEFYKLAAPKRLAKWEEKKTSDFVGEVLSWTYRFGVAQLATNLRSKYLGLKMDVPMPMNLTISQVVRDPSGPEWKKPDYVELVLRRFYSVYNPGRLERPLNDVVEFIVTDGVALFNASLKERYQDDLFTFENVEHVRWRGDFFDKLFRFFNLVDPEQVSRGLMQLVYWTERQPGAKKEDALNSYLRRKYKRDLNSIS